MNDRREPTPGRRRGATINPPNRFESTYQEADLEHITERELNEALREDDRETKTSFLADDARTILTHNKSPDIGFDYSVNPYRGCEHGCAYCYARPTHETLGMNAGIDFESKIMVKHKAPQLLSEALRKPSWQGAPIAMSGVTDCYQPAERRFRLTRGCLEVLLAHRNPVVIITKNVLVLRDLDLLSALAAKGLVKVYLSITSLDPDLQKVLEPRTPTPAARLGAARKLSQAGVPVGIMHAPVIPGLTDHELPQLLAAAAQAGAKTANYVILRLPLAVRPIFLAWLEEHYPLRASRVRQQVSDLRDGNLNDARFGSRMRGEGPVADIIAQTFRTFAKRYGLDGDLPAFNRTLFRNDPHAGRQLSLF